MRPTSCFPRPRDARERREPKLHGHRRPNGVLVTDSKGDVYVARLADLELVDGELSPSASGSGDVVGPAGAVDDRIATYDGVTGKLIQDGGKTIAGVLADAAASAAALYMPIGSGGSGDVVGPGSAVDDRIATFDGTTGKLIKDGGKTIATVLSDAATAAAAADAALFPIDNTELSDMAQATIKGRAAGAGTGDPQDLTASQVKAIVALEATFGVGLDGDGSAIATGAVGKFVRIPFAMTIESYTITADVSGSIVIDVWKAAGAIPTNGNSITASAPPTLSGAQYVHSTTLTGWTTSVAAGDVIGFEVDSASTVTKVTLHINGTRS
jgi:hypothetical protein